MSTIDHLIVCFNMDFMRPQSKKCFENTKLIIRMFVSWHTCFNKHFKNAHCHIKHSTCLSSKYLIQHTHIIGAGQNITRYNMVGKKYKYNLVSAPIIWSNTRKSILPANNKGLTVNLRLSFLLIFNLNDKF